MSPATPRGAWVSGGAAADVQRLGARARPPCRLANGGRRAGLCRAAHAPGSAPAPADRPRAGVAAAAASSSTAAPPTTTTPRSDPTLSFIDDATLEQLTQNLIKGASVSQYLEHAYWIQPSMVEGEIPKELSGTLLRNGPGLFEIGETRITQPFDGDGMICTFAFKDGRAFFRNKFVRTDGMVKEQRAGKPLYRSAFNRGGTDGSWIFNPFDFSVKNVANTNVVWWAGKLLALYERGLPHLLDNALTTVGTTDLDGSIGTPPFFGAHYRIVAGPGGDQLVAFSFGEAGSDALMTLWEYDSAFKCTKKIQTKIPGAAFGFFHDICVTPNHYVLVENPIRLDLFKLLTQYTFGKACIAECLIFDKALPVKVHLIPRDTPSGGSPATRTFELRDDPFFSFHHVNGYELENGRYIVVDTCAFNSIDFGRTLENVDISTYRSPTGRDELSRMVVDTQTGKVTRHIVSPRNCDLPGISPSASGRPHRHAYLNASLLESYDGFAPGQAVWKVTMPPEIGASQPFDRSTIESQVWHSGNLSQVCQEPVFVPRPGAQSEDDGWVMSLMLDTEAMRTSLVILDGLDLTKGPVAKINLQHHIPSGLHGSFTPAYLGPSPDAADLPPYNIKNGL